MNEVRAMVGKGKKSSIGNTDQFQQSQVDIMQIVEQKEVRKALEPEVNSLRAQPSLGILKITSSCSLEINL